MTLDADKGDGRFAVTESIRVRQGDSLSYELEIGIRQGGEVLDLSGYAVRLYASKPDGSAVIDGENLEVLDAAAGRVLYTVPRQLVDTVGRIAPCYLRVTEADNQSEWSLTTDSFELDVVRGVAANIASGEYIPEIDGLLADMDRQLADFSAAEDARASAEALRDAGEQARAEAERLRAEAEQARLSYEDARRGAEDARAAAESLRVTAEDARRAAEQARAEEFAVMAEKARPWSGVVLAPGEYDPVTFEPTVEPGEFCTVYFTPSADPTGANAYDEWMYVGGRWEKLGASSVEFDAATSEQIAGVLAGTLSQGGAAVTVTGLAAFKEGLDAAYAALSHGHAIADVEGLREALEGLDGRVAALPTFAEVNAKVGTGAGDEKVDSADVKGVPGDGGYLDVYARKGDDALMLRAFESGLLQMVGFDKDGYDLAWELSAGNLLSDVRGSATDLSYAALRALKPGCYLVPSTAANQPISGQGDGNLMVGRVSSNRVWAVVAYNTGAVYCAYGYEHGGSAENFKWRRVDNLDPGLARMRRGVIADLSWASLYNLAQQAPGTYTVSNTATGGPYSGKYANLFLAVSGGNRIVALLAYDNGPVYTMYGSDASHWTRIDNGAVSLSTIAGTLAVKNGGTGATSAAAARASLGISAGASSLKVGTTLLQWGYTGTVAYEPHAYHGTRVNLPIAYADRSYKVFALPYVQDVGNGDSLGWMGTHTNYPGGTAYFTVGFGNGTASSVNANIYWLTIGSAAS